MKFFIFVTVFLFGSFFITQNIWAVSSDILINEIGAYPTSTHEWVEVWNKGSEAVDLKSWKFWENNTNHSLKAVTTTDSIVSPGEFAVICQDGDVFLRDYPNFIGSVLDSSWSSLSEAGEEIGLKDDAGNFVEKFTYLPITKFSLERKDPSAIDYTATNWQENATGNTVGAQNSNFISNIIPPASTTTDNNSNESTSTDSNTSTEDLDLSQDNSTTTTGSSSTSILDWLSIKLNEIISDPIDGNEMVELYNIGTSTVDLNGGKICDSTQSSCKSLNDVIASHDWIMADLFTNRYLNNDGDSVILKDPEGNIVDEVSYGTGSLSAPGKDESIMRRADGVDTDSDSDWAVTTAVTEGGANVLEAPVTPVGNSGGSNSNSSGGVSISQTATKTAKISTKTATTTIVDKVKMSWQLDWPYGLDINEVGKFDALGTADPRGGEVHFLWNFGDGATSTDFTAAHAYATSGIYIVSVLASSTEGTMDKKEFKVNVGEEFSIKNSQIKISGFEVTSTDSETQFIEIKNYLDQVQNISNWKIKNNSGKFFEIPENTILSGSSSLKFLRSVTHLAFDKDGDEIKLETSNGQLIDQVVLPSEKLEKKVNRITSAGVSANSAWRVVRGTVTVLPDTLGKQIFYISADDGGIQIYQYKKDFPDLKIGDFVQAGGEESEVNGIKRIKIKNRYSIKILSSNKDFSAPEVALVDLSEDKIGGIVKVAGDITEIKSNFFYIDDNTTEAMIYWKKGRQNKTELNVGDKVSIIGIVDKSSTGLRVLPRSAEDIVVVTKSQQVLSAQKNANQATEREVAEKYLTATAGGLTTLLFGLIARTRGTVLVESARKIASATGKLIKRG